MAPYSKIKYAIIENDLHIDATMIRIMSTSYAIPLLDG